MVLIDQYVLMSMLAMQNQINCDFRVETEPTRLRWENVLWDLEYDPNSQFFWIKHVHCNDLEIKIIR